jgi:hypothetical protein
VRKVSVRTILKSKRSSVIFRITETQMLLTTGCFGAVFVDVGFAFPAFFPAIAVVGLKYVIEVEYLVALNVCKRWHT